MTTNKGKRHITRLADKDGKAITKPNAKQEAWLTRHDSLYPAWVKSKVMEHLAHAQEWAVKLRDHAQMHPVDFSNQLQQLAREIGEHLQEAEKA